MRNFTLQMGLLFALLCLLPDCTGDDLIEIEGVERHLYALCMDMPDNHYVVDNEETLQALLDIGDFSTVCPEEEVPNVDFQSQTLVLKLVRTNFCEPFYKYQVLANTANKTYEVHIEVKGEDTCPDVIAAYHWLTFSKIPESYQVDFVAP